MNLDEAIAALAEANKDEVAALLEKKAGGLHQAIFQKGYDVAHGRKVKDADQLKGEIDKLKSELALRTEELSKVGSGQPDRVKAYEEELTRIRTEKAETEKVYQLKLLQKDRQRAIADLRAVLIRKGVDPDYAEVLTQKATIESRVRVESDGSIQVMQEGKEIPIATEGSKAPLDALAEELVPKLDPKWLTSKVDAGSGDRGGAGQPGTASFYDKIRAEERAKLDAVKKQREESATILRERLGITGSTL